MPSSPSTPTASVTAGEYLESQLLLEKEAREIMPYDPNTCSYQFGPIRQQLFACLTCISKDGNPSGVCYSCSIQCHASHELVELFTKRNFACDCGTTRMRANSACTLRGSPGALADDIPSASNEYNHNFAGEFCVCGHPYNPAEETGTMHQCFIGAACGEDWYHEECILGYPHGTFTKRERDRDEKDHNEKKDALEEKNIPIDVSSDDEEVTIPGFPPADSFEYFVCWKCTSRFPKVFQTIVEALLSDLQVLPYTPVSLEPMSKKRKVDGPYSLFFDDAFKARLSQLKDSSDVSSFVEDHPFLVSDDPVYEPPPDISDDEGSIYDMGSKMLNSMPREQAIESIQAYESIKDKLKDFFKPFAEGGKVVTEDEVRSFFLKIKKP
ncbi:hypothetical protein BABINDRAFT_45969 [Babjeviella inositovora NRRL Y-12698]|uniref:UBR-type domain-containing protein n=1 Tax=Babjeviella inositovora NRRL Y-12698 TaxID=984486 RepID=A0A1E3QY23_9ASCO|nr:uncharacterized protein BABINDRAFT_45969 [Babjeviella inositovora NRRL Y-12698]ODQ81957.1 hypothetical protein BABINDRAFT_45969 [Babjeviella inositovora NRRL Y-12698]